MGRAKVIPPKTLLLPYQSAWVKDRSRLKLAVKARQIGWSWASAYSIIRRKAVKDAQLDAWISSRDEIQAKLFLDDCKGFAMVLHAGAQDLGERVIDDKGNSAFVLQMANGLRIHSLSSNPDAQAGKRGDRILDEAGLHKDFKQLYDIAYPGITWGGQLEIFSTPRGTQQYFSILLKEIQEGDNPKGFCFHRVTLQDALDQGFLYKLQQKLPKDDERQEMDEADYFDYVKRGCTDDETFNQEYMCVAADDEGAFIEYELIDKCKIKGIGKTGIDDKPENKQKKKGKWVCEWRSADPIGNGALYIGWDLAKISDLSVLWMAEDVAGRLVTRRVKAMHKMDFAEQYKEVGEYMSMRNVRRMCMDASGMGERPFEEMRATYGWLAEGVKFTGQAKEAMAYKLRGDMEDAKFLIPDERFVVADLRKMRKIITAANNIRFEGERDKDGHSDRFWAAALCREAKGSNSDAWADPGDVDELDALDDAAYAPRSVHPYATGYRRIA